MRSVLPVFSRAPLSSVHLQSGVVALAALVMVGLVGLGVGPAAAQQPEEATLVDRLEETGQLEEMSPEMIQGLVGRSPQARRALPMEVRRQLPKMSLERSPLFQAKSGISDLTIEEAVQGIGTVPWSDPVLAGGVRGVVYPAGDVNGDGTDDWIARVTTADERTSDLSDRVSKTFLRYGGGDFSARFYDEVYYQDLQPAGNLVGSENADAIGFTEDGVRVFEGSNKGYLDRGEYTFDFGFADEFGEGLTPFDNPGDLDGDGHDDLLFVESARNPEQPEIRVLFGADDPGDMEVRSYSQSFDGFNTFNYQVDDLDDDGGAEVVRVAGNQNEGDPAGTVEIFAFDESRSLTVQQEFASEAIEAAEGRISPEIANLDGSGLAELVLDHRYATEDTTLVFTADADNPGQYDSTPLEYPRVERHVGDVNGDGRADFWVNAPDPDTRAAFALGPENVSDGFSSQLDIPFNNGDGLASFLTNPDRSVLGDLDGDDRDEFVLEVFTGNSGSPVHLDVSDGTVERQEFSPETSKHVLQTTNVGDWNGDGSDDVAFLRSDGRVEIYYEDPTTSISPDLTIDRQGTYRFSSGGSSMATGDFTGDGNPNLAVGWPSYSETVAVYEAGEGTEPIRTIGVSDLGLDSGNLRDAVSIVAEVANVGDVNADGTDDFAIALPSDFSGTTLQAFLFLGQDPLSEQVDVTIDYRDQTSQYDPILGTQIQALGDINGDGIEDFAVSDREGFARDRIGRIYVHYGQSEEADALDFQAPDVTITPQVGEGEFVSWFPWGMATGDFNDDGTVDLATKPLLHQQGDDGAEAIRIYYGGSGFDGTPDEKLYIPSAPINPRYGGEKYMTFSNGTLTTVPQSGGPDRLMVETGSNTSTNALIFADNGSGFEPTIALRAPDQSAPLGEGSYIVNWPSPQSSAIGDFTGGDQTRLLLPQQSPNFRGGPAYTFELGSGSGEEEPVASSTESIDAANQAGTTVEFGDTGTSVTFSDKTEGAADVTVDRFGSAPDGAAGIDGNASEYRVEITAGGDLTVGDSSEVRFDVSQLEGVSDPGAVTIYSRDLSGLGAFQALDTQYDEGAGELFAFVSGFSEFAFGSETEPLFSYPEQVAVDASRSFGDASGPGDYRMVALPGAVDRDLSESLSGEAGTDWQAYWDDGSDFVKYDGSDTFNLEAGNGFWVTSLQDLAIEDTLQTVSLTENQAATVPLNGEWTIVSNPFDRDVLWRDVLGASGLSAPLWAYDANDGFVQADTMKSAATGAAYYVFNGAGADALTLPYPAVGGDKAAPETQEASSALAISARPASGDGPPSTVEVGLGAKEAHFAPPGRFEPVSLRLTPSSGERALMRALRPAEDGGQTFALRVTSRVEGPVEIEAGDLNAVEGRSAVLLHPEAGKTYDLRRQQTVTIEPDGEAAELKVAVGTDDYTGAKSDQVLPTKVSFATYPNPMRQQGTLEYALPEDQEVTLRVYDVLGRQVATLEQGRKKAGTHTVRLETDQLSSGVYFGRLQAGDRTLTKKITVVR